VVAPAEDDLDIEDLIADQQMVIAISHSGYIKSLPLATYRQQRRGGVGITGMDLKEDDYIEHLFVCSTHDYLLFFTNRGKIYRSKVYDLPEAGRASKGRYLGNVLPMREGERVQSVLATRDFSETQYLAFGTRQGIIKKTEFGLYNTPIKADGIIALNIRDDDELVAVRRVDEGDEILMVSHEGLTARFRESDVRAQLRPASGVRGMDVSGEDNYVLAMDVARPGQDLLVVTENGYGKRTAIDEYRLTSRGAKGVKTITFVEAKGLLAGALVVREHQDLVFISQNGMVQRTSVRGINRYGRASQGVRVMNLREDDTVSAVALVVESETGDAIADDAPLSLDASGVGDEAALDGEGVIAGDPDADGMLSLPEVESDEMPDSDIEDEQPSSDDEDE
jgi:DNA gyrase subunit A